MSQQSKKFLIKTSFFLSLIMSVSAQATPLDLVNIRAQTSIQTNVMLTIDNSGSTGLGYMNDPKTVKLIRDYLDPKLIFSTWFDWRDSNHIGNLIYYNPKVEYKPWPGFSDAPVRSTIEEYGYFSFAIWKDSAGYSDMGDRFIYDPQPNGNMDLWDDYDEVILENGRFYVESVTHTGMDNRNCAAKSNAGINSAYEFEFEDQAKYEICAFGRTVKTTENADAFLLRTTDAEMQNIANWIKYHSTVLLSIKTIVSKLVDKYPNFNFGLDVLNLADYFMPIKPKFSSTEEHNQRLLDALFRIRAGGFTPLRGSMVRVGDYFKNGIVTPAGSFPSPITSSCQANFHFLLTDGYGNGRIPREFGDVDGDGSVSTMADIARYYYENDLSDTLPNSVPNFARRCESIEAVTHQHINFIPVAFGAIGTLVPDANKCWPTKDLGVDSDWGKNSTDDLWHAAYNSRGVFNTEASPNALFDELDSMFKFIENTTVFNKNSAINSYKLGIDSKVYFSKSLLNENTGDLLMLDSNVNDNNEIEFEEIWSAATLLKDNTKRKIFSYDTDKKKGFKISNNSKSQAKDIPKKVQEDLGAILGSFGENIHRLPIGTILNSDVTYVGHNDNTSPKRIGIQDKKREAEYLAYKKSRRSVASMVYVGSFSNMLHAIDAETGQELFSYVPSAFLHEGFFEPNYKEPGKGIDGKHFVADAYLPKRGGWRTLLIGATRLGAQTIFALDVTDPENFSSDDVLWEFSDQHSEHMGFSFGRASIGTFENGKEYAIFGNGYNNTADFKGNKTISKTGAGALYILGLSNGKMERVFLSDATQENDPKGLKRPNGFAEPSLVDSDSNGLIDVVYIGDFYGNLYSINANAKKVKNWVSYSGTKGDTLTPIMSGSAVDNSPITIRPTVTKTQVKIEDEIIIANLVIYGTGQDVTKTVERSQEYLMAMVHDLDYRTALPQKSKMVEHKVSFSDGLLLSEGKELNTTTKAQKSQYSDQGWFIKFDGKLSNYSIVRDLRIVGGELNIILDPKPGTASGACEPEEPSLIAMVVNPRTGSPTANTVFIDKDGNRLTKDDKLVIGENVPVSAAASQLVVDDDGRTYNMYVSDGKVILRERGMLSKGDGRQNWRRMY